MREGGVWVLPPTQLPPARIRTGRLLEELIGALLTRGFFPVKGAYLLSKFLSLSPCVGCSVTLPPGPLPQVMESPSGTVPSASSCSCSQGPGTPGHSSISGRVWRGWEAVQGSTGCRERPGKDRLSAGPFRDNTSLQGPQP